MAGVDRISALPEEIRVSILSRLSIADAVRTSALSPSWRHLWTFLPGFRANLTSTREPDSPGEISCRIDQAEIVGHILSSLRGPIRYFFLMSYRFYDNPPANIQRFLDLIFQKGGLRILSICYLCRSVRLQLPCFRSLKDLTLDWVNISLPSDFGGFEQLSYLKLSAVRISQQDIQALINRSKNLTSIECLLWPEEGGPPLSVMFNCPLLEYLKFYFGMNDAEARIIYAPCLESAHVSADIISAPLEELVCIGAATLKFMADIAQVSHLSLDRQIIMCLSQVAVPHTLQVHFCQLRYLKLHHGLFYIDQGMYKVFCCLLRSIPFLEILEWECYIPMEDFEDLNESDPITSNEYRKKEDGFRCLGQTLRRVEISMLDLVNLEGLMWMMHFFLLNANVLELIKIEYSKDKCKVKPRLLEELCEVEKASSDAQIWKSIERALPSGKNYSRKNSVIERLSGCGIQGKKIKKMLSCEHMIMFGKACKNSMKKKGKDIGGTSGDVPNDLVQSRVASCSDQEIDISPSWLHATQEVQVRRVRNDLNFKAAELSEMAHDLLRNGERLHPHYP